MKKILFILLFIALNINATYYVKNGGSDDADGLSDANAWQTISKVNAIAKSGDTVSFQRDSKWREQLTLTNSNMIYTAYGFGDNPVMYGSDAPTVWNDEGSNVWSATLTTDPDAVIFEETDSTWTWGTERNTSALTESTGWYWDSNVIYVYSTDDPDTEFTNVECQVRFSCFNKSGTNEIDNVTISGITFIGGTEAGIYVNRYDCDYWTISDSIAHHNGQKQQQHGEGFHTKVSNSTITDCIAYENGRHGFFIYANEDLSQNSFTSCTAYNNYHNNFDMQGPTGMTDLWLDKCISYLTSDFENPPDDVNGFFFNGGSTNGLHNVTLSNNLIVNMSGAGIHTSNDGNDYWIYNNTIANCWGSSIGYCIYLNNDGARMTLRNNIYYDAEKYCFLNGVDVSSIDNDYNLYWQPDGNNDVGRSSGTNYTDWETWKSGTGFDANSIWKEDPYFSNYVETYVGGNFYIGTASACRNAGATVTEVTDDIIDVSRPQESVYDIGAYEYVVLPVSGPNLRGNVKLKGNAKLN